MKPFHLRYVLIAFLAVVVALWGIFLYHPTPLALGEKQYGGILRLSAKTSSAVLYPLADNTLEHHRIQQLIFEPLLQPDQSKKGWSYFLATKIVLDASRKKVLIHLRKKVHFAEDPCFRFHSAELTAEDVAFTLSTACSKKATTRYEPITKAIHHIQILDRHTLEITLNGTYNHFLNMLCSPSLGILSKQAAKHYGTSIIAHPVGTGPFILDEPLLKQGGGIQKQLVFKRNPQYWRQDRHGNQLPYIDQIQLQLGISNQKAQQLFFKNQLDLLFDLPVDHLKSAFGTLGDAKSGKTPLHEIYIKNAAKVHFIQFNCMAAPFNRIEVRKAVALAIDAQTICEEVLKGEGSPLNKQFIPVRNVANASPPDLRSIKEKVAAAQLLLNKAGYSKMNPIPPVTFYVGAPKNSLAYSWSMAVAEMLQKNLAIRLELKEQFGPSKMTTAAMWRTGWVGDYPGPESYLRLLYSQAQKPIYYKNKRVDSLYKTAITTQNMRQRNEACRLCEQTILDQQALVAIYSEDFIVLKQLRIRDFELNETGLLDYGQLFIKALK